MFLNPEYQSRTLASPPKPHHPQDEAGLCNDLSFLAHLPELCDITFMVTFILYHLYGNLPFISS